MSKDPGCDFDGGILRIFDAGHQFEALSIRWLRAAGSDVRDRGADDEPFSFSVANGRLRGHAGGVIVSGPALLTALNRDSLILHHEVVPFDTKEEGLSNRAVTILRAAERSQLPPRIVTTAASYICRFCPYGNRCWREYA